MDLPVQVYGSGMPSGAQEMLQLPWSLIIEASKDPLLSPLLVSKAGYFHVAHGHWIERAWIGEFNLIYCVAGSGWLRYRDRVLDVQAGDLLLVPLEAHAYGASKATPWSIHWLHLQGEVARQLLTMAGFNCDAPIWHLGVSNELCAMFTEIVKTLRGGFEPINLLHAANLTRPLLSFVVRQRQGATDAPAAGVAAAVQLMQQRLDQPLSLSQLAATSGMSVPHFSRLFRQEIGSSPIDYLIRLKVDSACERLATTSLTVVDIARSLGYADPYYFSRIFKKVVGVAPTVYRGHRRHGE